MNAFLSTLKDISAGTSLFLLIRRAIDGKTSLENYLIILVFYNDICLSYDHFEGNLPGYQSGCADQECNL